MLDADASSFTFAASSCRRDAAGNDVCWQTAALAPGGDVTWSTACARSKDEERFHCRSRVASDASGFGAYENAHGVCDVQPQGRFGDAVRFACAPRYFSLAAEPRFF